MKRLGFSLSFIIKGSAYVLFCLLLVSGYQAVASNEKLQQTTGKEQNDIQVPPPPLSEDIFPCTECHADMEINNERRELEDFHDDIILKHDEKNRWCMDCHDSNNRDMLHTASGELISFNESYKLCGQCHGPKLRDWEKGIHGRRTGNWNGRKEYQLCAHCHDPHSPRYKKMKPEPAPKKPGKIK
jgi:hypothetical protein